MYSNREWDGCVVPEFTPGVNQGIFTSKAFEPGHNANGNIDGQVGQIVKFILAFLASRKIIQHAGRDGYGLHVREPKRGWAH
jgi:hypothetical protein